MKFTFRLNHNIYLWLLLFFYNFLLCVFTKLYFSLCGFLAFLIFENLMMPSTMVLFLAFPLILFLAYIN